MRSLCSLFRHVILILFLANLCAAQKIELDNSACRLMYNVLVAMKAGAPRADVSKMLDSVLDTKPYRTMFKHYNRSWRPNHLPILVFKRMIMSLEFKDAYKKGENQRADQMFPFWVKFYNDLNLFRQNLHQLENTKLKEPIDRGVAYAQNWLPDDWHIPNFYLPIHPNGGSPAFTIDDAQGYDFFQLPRDSLGNIRWNDLLVTISHESHHLGLHSGLTNIPSPAGMSSFDSVAYNFLSLFVGEGTATKFINNYPGGCVPVVDNSRDSSFDNAEIGKWWRRYTTEESDLFTRLITTFEQAYSGRLSPTQLQAETSQFWMSGYVSPVYFVGSELFGAVYHGYGKEGAFTAMRDLRKLFFLYNNAIKNKPDILGRCYVIPDSLVQHALAIGTPRQ